MGLFDRGGDEPADDETSAEAEPRDDHAGASDAGERTAPEAAEEASADDTTETPVEPEGPTYVPFDRSNPPEVIVSRHGDDRGGVDDEILDVFEAYVTAAGEIREDVLELPLARLEEWANVERPVEGAKALGGALAAVVDERTVSVTEDLPEDQFFQTEEGTQTLANRYDLEKTVSFEKKRHFTEVNRYWVNKPYAFVVIFHSNKENETKYYLIEPHLTPIEEEVAEFLSEKLRAAIKYESDLLDAVDRNDVKLTVGHKRRFHPAHEKARDLVASGAVGEPRLVTGAKDGGLLNWGTHVVDLTRYLLGDPDLAWAMGQVERETDRYERGLAAEDRCVGQVCFADGTRLTYESDMPGPAVADSTIQVTGSEGVLEVELDAAVTVTNGSGTERYAPEPEFRDLYDPYLEAHLDWLDGERTGHRCDARVGHSVTEVLMAIYESARTTGVVRAPLRTRANPLTAMIEAGELPVEKPGRYDIRLPYGSVRSED